MSRECGAKAHAGCAHFVTVGGGFNPRRLRLEFGAGLCPCSCHAPCPVATEGKRLTVSPQVWRESCTCPGADDARRRLDESGAEFPDFSGMWEDRRRQSRARREACEATRARAAGKSRDEIRAIYLAEREARGLGVPSEAVLDAVADQIAGNPLPAARLAADGVVQMGKALRDLSRLFRSG
jgi:hypothetical protein